MIEAQNLIQTLKQELTHASLINLNQIQIKYLGRNGLVNQLFTKIKNLNLEEKKTFGQQINQLKEEVNRLINLKKNSLIQQKDMQEKIDVTRPGKNYPRGSLHLITLAVNQITAIFTKIGFIQMSYPEVEWEYFAFTALNMPAGHPARDDFETSFIDFPPHPKYGRMVLTPHTSSGQVREMLRLGKPPIRMINISKTYRPNYDATHVPMFYQFEGLCVDEGINITHLKGTIDYFVKAYFEENTQIRLRPHHFQFTEPSFEVDITCTVCHGKGEIDGKKCKICKSGWLELGGCGMVHPYVLQQGNINSALYTGWAFGFGIERVIMMKYGINDIRYYYSSDIRFLEQF
jgi:phenylalanyl-tRNA synthetase alpha chain